MAKIAIAGARGFIGSRLALRLSQEHSIVGFTRASHPGTSKGIAEWRSVDLLSLKDAESGLQGIDYAYYLVHSMMPTGGMVQGGFEDLDFISADNFARAAAKQGVKQIVYLGGIVPNKADLSLHLRSRLEVESVLGSRGTPVVALRAGLVVGGEGSSFVILRRLVGRLPIMICPAWMKTKMQPIAVEDVVELLAYSLGRDELSGRAFDVGGPEALSYNEMVLEAARVLGVHRTLIPVPIRSTGLSVLWISLITGAPRKLIRPLVESLTSEMVAPRRELQKRAGIPGLPFREAFRRAIAERASARPVAFVGATEKARDVRSVQRLPLPPGKDAEWVAEEYQRWLPRLLPVLLNVRDGVFRIRPFRRPALVLEYSRERSAPDRALFYIRGGYLARLEGRGRLEFRETPDRTSVLAAVHDFLPRLPWAVYRWTQAVVHLWVMHRFGRHLATLAALPRGAPRPLAGTDTTSQKRS